MIELKIKYFSDKLPRLEFIGGKSDWIDLRAAEDAVFKKGDFKLVSLGIAVELPSGYEAHVVPRSSLYKNFGLIQTNSCGIIDESYSGDDDMWYAPLLAMRDTEVHFGDRICQFRLFRHQDEISFIEAEHLSKENRGGFGSTGIK